jgi:hypothetical protein
MTCQKGYPNRWRRKTYQDLLASFDYTVLCEESCYDYSEAEIAAVKDRLPNCFEGLPQQELSCSDYFFVAQKNS